MAALVEGLQYGLSSQGHSNENRTLVFVKLTDSALKAIEEYLSIRGNTGRQPTIQFLGNQGVITFPASQNLGGEHSFDFTISSNSESEGLGSFECVKKCDRRSLDSFGSMQYKMHIHAKDDIYQTTKSRMAAAEVESKKNCTKVIKASGPYVGRKVKVKKHFTPVIPPKITSSSPPNAALSKPSINNLIHSKPSINGHSNHSNGISSSYSHSNNAKTPVVPKTGNPDIMKKSYRERIIHLLGLRPYKKPELLTRLMKDGIKEKDKKSLTSILSQVAVMKDNAYQLARHVWNEVQEDWPFYTEAEKQLLKRRMPQNLTPPSAVECEQSPPRLPSRASPSLQQKRQSGELIPTKKQRISHYNNKNELVQHGNSKSEPVQNVTKLDSNTFNGHHKSDVNNSLVNSKTDSNSNKSDYHSKSSDSRMFSGYNHHISKPEVNGYSGGKYDSTGFINSGYHNGYSLDLKHDSNSLHSSNAVNGHAPNNSSNCHSHRSSGKLSSSSVCNGSTGGSRQSTPSSSPDSSDAIDARGPSSQSGNGSPSSISEFPDYLQKYTVITSAEQRAQFKADFNAEYEIYRYLHTIIERVSKRFSALEQILRRTVEGSDEWKKIKDQIIKEYKENKRNSEYQDTKKRFNYLHQKLSHIKKLVLDYDSAHTLDS